MKNAIHVVALLLLTWIPGAAQEAEPLLIRDPALNRTHIVFVYAGDIWSVPREGGGATRLTAGVGVESGPSFSPDGRTIAFTGEYDGNRDVYTVPAEGGVPKRITYHPAPDVVAGWTPDGRRVLFVSSRDSYSVRFDRLFTIPVDGVFPAEVPLPMGYEGSYSPDGTGIAYVPIPRAFTAWKRYRGGMTTPVWIARLDDSGVEKIPRDNSNDFNPMWIGNRVYFLSDRNGPVSLFSFDTSTKKVAQLIPNKGLDIKSAAAGPDAIVYEQFGSIFLYDLKSGKSRKVNVTVAGDLASVRGKYEKAAGRISNAELSPTGVRAVFEARGEILTVPAEKGNVRNLTNTSGIAERDPAWSPDGKWIAYFSDESGEYALHIRAQTGLGEVRKFGLGDPPSFFYAPSWSPDSRKICYFDKRLNLWYIDLDKGTPVKIDETLFAAATLGPAWAPDSRWVAYTKTLKSWLRAVFIYSLEEGKSYQVTDGLSDARYARFDESGKYLYFTASTDTANTSAGLDMSRFPLRPTRSVYLAVLRKDLPSPLAPESDEEKPKQDKPKEEGKAEDQQQEKEKKEEGAEAAGRQGDRKEPVTVTIDFENIGQRIVALPVPARSYAGLSEGKAGVLFLLESVPPGPGVTGMLVHKYDLEKRKLDKVLENVRMLVVSANGEKMLYRQGDNYHIAATGQPVKAGEGRIKTDEMEVYVDPKAEWTQMYREVWRIERDFFYDPSYHGLDLKAAEKKYEPWLERLSHRADLNYMFNEMLGELSVGHLYVRGGDVPDANRVQGGLLGADYSFENGRYRFARIFNGENWNPEARAPLTQPGVNVTAGEYLLSVNGRNLTANDNIYSYFEGTASKQVILRVGPNPDGSNSRDVTVVPVPSEIGLRNLAWIEDNRRKVERMSEGRLAYVYLPDTAGGGYTNFNRYYFAQLDREGAVVDERFNSGGQAADYIVDFLRKRVLSYWAVREGLEATTPFGVVPGPKVMIINEYAGSGGDALPWMFRKYGIGPLVGKRTWGGLVGIGGYPQLIDGGSVTAPHFAFYNADGEWEVENRGVAPDVEVELDPKAWREGRDPQLEKAVALAMDALRKDPPKRPKRPPYPNYHRPAPAAAPTSTGTN